MTKIYELTSSYGELSSFIEDYPDGQESIIGIAMDRGWQPFEDYKPITLALCRGDTGKKIINLISVVHLTLLSCLVKKPKKR